MRHQRTPLADRFWPKVDTDGPVPEYAPELGPCWLWTSARNAAGYGQVHAGTDRNRNVMAHRVAYELVVGPIPPGLELDHLCRVPLCVNPSHVEPVTRAENNRRSNSLSARRARQTHCIHGHEFTPDNTYVPPGQPDSRRCKTCRCAASARARSKAAA